MVRGAKRPGQVELHGMASRFSALNVRRGGLSLPRMKVTCYHCRQTVQRQIIRENRRASGYVMLPTDLGVVAAPVGQSERYAYACPNCGAPFAGDAELSRLNGEWSRRTLISLGVVFLFGLMAVVAFVWMLESRF